MSSSRVCRFTLAETVLRYSAQFEFLDVSTDNVPGQVGSPISLILDSCSSSDVRVCVCMWGGSGGLPLAKNSWIGQLAWLPAHARMQEWF